MKKSGRITTKAIFLIPPLFLYAGFFLKWPETHNAPWFASAAALFIAYALFYAFKRNRLFSLRLAVFSAGLIIAGAAEQYGFLHMAFIPYALLAALSFDAATAIYAFISVALFEASHIVQRGLISEGLAVVSVSSIVSLLAVVFRRLREKELSELKSRHTGYTYGENYRWEALEAEGDPEIKEIMKNVMFTLAPDSASLFMADGEGLKLRCSTSSAAELMQGGILQDAFIEKRTMAEGRLKEGGTGYNRPGKISSAVASPVKDENICLGILVIDSGSRNAFRDSDIKVADLFASQISIAIGRRRLYDATKKNLSDIEAINRASSRLLTSLDIETLIGLSMEGIREIAPLDAHFFLKEEGGYREIKSGAKPDKTLSLEGTLSGVAASEGRDAYIANTSQYNMPVIPGGKAIMSALIIPLRSEDETLGVLALTSSLADAVRPREQTLIKLLSNHVAFSLNNALLHAEIKRQAITDALTGLYNRRHFNELLEGEVKRTGRGGRPFSLLLIDIDFFKKVNDTYGHPAGDQVLKEVSSVLKRTIRGIDHPARYGGEEFAALLVETGADGAFMTAERLRRAIRKNAVIFEGNSMSITISIGISTCPLDSASESGTIDRADKALYHAKKTGRDKVVTWSSIAAIAGAG